MTETTEEREARVQRRAAKSGLAVVRVEGGYRLRHDCCGQDASLGHTYDLDGAEAAVTFGWCWMHLCSPAGKRSRRRPTSG